MNGTLIHAYLRASGMGSDHEQVGPFLAHFTPGTDHPMRNYAIPDDDAQPSRIEVDALIETFERRGLKPRLEYAADAAPRLETILLDAGFEVEDRLTVMTCDPSGDQQLSEPADFEVGVAESDRDHIDAIVVAKDAYGELGLPPGEDALAGRRPMSGAGGAVVLARDRATCRPAGSGVLQIPRAGVSELGAVGTRSEFRNRGVAQAVTARLVRAASEHDVALVWLTAEGAQAERVYARAGFVLGDLQMVHISRSGGPRATSGAAPG